MDLNQHLANSNLDKPSSNPINKTQSQNELIETLEMNEDDVILDIDNKLYADIFENKIPHSKEIINGLHYLIGKNKNGELILCSWEQERGQNGREKTLGEIVFAERYNFLEMTKKNKDEISPLIRGNKKKYIVTLGVYPDGMNNEQHKKYKITPNIFEVPSNKALVMAGTLYSKELTSEEFSTYMNNSDARNISS